MKNTAASRPDDNIENGEKIPAIKPPVVYKTALAVMAVGKLWLWPRAAPIFKDESSSSLKASCCALVVGIPIFVAGALFAIQSKRLFKKTGTPMMGGPSRSVAAKEVVQNEQQQQRRQILHTTGAGFSVTRNPMYLGITVALLGAGVVTNCWYHAFVPALINWIVMDLYYVPLEERQLERYFGNEYLEYKRRVPRWLLTTEYAKMVD